MALIKGKYQRVTVDLEKSEYREVFIVASNRGCTLVSLIRTALREHIRILKALAAKEQAEIQRLKRVL